MGRFVVFVVVVTQLGNRCRLPFWVVARSWSGRRGETKGTDAAI